MSNKIYPKGIFTFPKNQKAPDFVLGIVVIDVNAFVEWMQDNKSLLTEYKGAKQLRLQILKGKNDAPNFMVDTFKPTPGEGDKHTTKTPLF